MDKNHNLQNTAILRGSTMNLFCAFRLCLNKKAIGIFCLPLGEVWISTCWPQRCINNTLYKYNWDARRISKYLHVLDRSTVDLQCTKVNSSIHHSKDNYTENNMLDCTNPHLCNTSSMKVSSHSCSLCRLHRAEWQLKLNTTLKYIGWFSSLTTQTSSHNIYNAQKGKKEKKQQRL